MKNDWNYKVGNAGREKGSGRERNNDLETYACVNTNKREKKRGREKRDRREGVEVRVRERERKKEGKGERGEERREEKREVRVDGWAGESEVRENQSRSCT